MSLLAPSEAALGWVCDPEMVGSVQCCLEGCIRETPEQKQVLQLSQVLLDFSEETWAVERAEAFQRRGSCHGKPTVPPLLREDNGQSHTAQTGLRWRRRPSAHWRLQLEKESRLNAVF